MGAPAAPTRPLEVPDAPDRTEVPAVRPTWRTSLPFVAAFVVGLALVLPAPGASWPLVAVAGGTTAAALVLHGVNLRRSSSGPLDMVPVWLAYLVTAMVLVAAGGTVSGLAGLVLVPMFFLAMFGTRLDVLAGVVLTAAALVLPGLPGVPGAGAWRDDWRAVVVLLATAGLVGPVCHHLTRRLRSETALSRRTADRLRRVMDGATHTAVLTCDAEGRVAFASRGAERLLGRGAPDLVGLEVELLLAPEGPGRLESLRHDAGTGQESRVRAVRTPDGSHRWWRVAATRLSDPDGGLLLVATDITSTVEAQAEVAAAEERWRLMMACLPDTTVVALDEDLVMTLVTGAGAMAEQLGSATGRPLAEVSSPANVRLVEEAVARARAEGQARLELVSSRTGAVHDVDVVPLRRPLDGAGPREVLLVARNVSEAKERARRLAAALDRAERLYLDAPTAIVLVDEEGRISSANPAFARLLGGGGASEEHPERLVGRALAGLASAPAQEAVAHHLSLVRASPEHRASGELDVVTPDGRTLHVLLSSTLLADGQVLVHVVDLTSRRHYEQQLTHLADHDVLTGLANRRRFEAELSAHLERCRRYGATGALLMLDLDRFKEVNDLLGHGAGDELLVSVAAHLRQGLRASDVVARLGGDEFAVLLPQASPDAAEYVAAGIVDRVRQHTASLDGARRNVSASVGVVMVESAATAEELLSLVDMTMYDAKDAGRDQLVMLRPGAGRSRPRTSTRLDWGRRVEEALENDRLVLHLQPQADLATGRVVSAEALVRLLDDEGRAVPPSRFLPAAERAGSVARLDAWVVERAVGVLAGLQREWPSLSLAVNLSGQSMGDATVERALSRALAAHDVDHAGLVLEVTETAAVADLEAARSFAERVSRDGVRFALDDFGAGFGSFYYLKHLVFDHVKVDGEFVSTCHVNDVDRQILRSITGVAHGLGKTVVAEFASEPAIIEVLREEGVDLAQGHLVGRPVPLEQFVADLRSRPVRLGSGAAS